jgi:hypothetical protein
MFKLWKLSDGFEGKKSTHGTWLLIDCKYELQTNNIFKFGNNTFSIKQVENYD